MDKNKTQIGSVSYNAATQSFEALVTFHTDQGRVRVASQYPAPLATDFSVAANGLWNEALRRIDLPGSLRARLQSERIEARQTTRTMSRPSEWLHQLFGLRSA
ncbi:hypothetical protein [Puniceibacterium sp. IMCC21224]|uniref:hypothetical protein n=1 Tax=Puniceibacterium sp. IMCC21224 TaxID=1618204 RepID=UPI00065D6B54|nr:hypothetical protein [Puniceibacterium sp. IMCC21224]KMK65297.1 hypothetical protein IMCC21224_11128 [Puniceibacterium sp. IMCC21224]